MIEQHDGQLGFPVGRPFRVLAVVPVQVVDVQAAQRVGRADHRDHPILDPVAEQARQREVAEVVGAHVGLESVSRPRQRQAQHAGVVDQHVNAIHRVGELSHAGQIGKIEVGDLDVAGHAAAACSAFGMVRQAITTL